MARRPDIERLRDEVGTFDAPIGAVQLPQTGVHYDRRGNPKPLRSGEAEHPEPAPDGARRRRRDPEPELAFTTDLFVDDPQRRSVLTACHKALSGAQITEGQLRRKLQKAGFEEPDVEFGIERCVANGLIDDRRYAEAFIESRVRRGHGRLRIRQDLAHKHVDRVLVDQLLAEQVDDEQLDDAAFAVAQRKFARVDLDDRAARAKAVRWLLSRGYSGAQAHDALRRVQQERAEG